MNNRLFNLALALALLILCSGKVALDPIKVKFVVDDDYPPYSYVENGIATGVYLEMLRAAAKELSNYYHIEFEPMPWKRALKEIENGNAFAIVPPYTHQEARPFIGPYSVPLLTERVVAICHSDVPLQTMLSSSMARSKRLDAINIGINAGYLMFDERYYPLIANQKIKVWENKSTEANLKKLLEKKLDCYVNDSRAIQFNLAKMNNGFDVKLIEMDEISRQTAHIGFSNSQHAQFTYKADLINKLNTAIDNVKRNSTAYRDD